MDADDEERKRRCADPAEWDGDEFAAERACWRCSIIGHTATLHSGDDPDRCPRHPLQPQNVIIDAFKADGMSHFWAHHNAVTAMRGVRALKEAGFTIERPDV